MLKTIVFTIAMLFPGISAAESWYFIDGNRCISTGIGGRGNQTPQHDYQALIQRGQKAELVQLSQDGSMAMLVVHGASTRERVYVRGLARCRQTVSSLAGYR